MLSPIMVNVVSRGVNSIALPAFQSILVRARWTARYLWWATGDALCGYLSLKGLPNNIFAIAWYNSSVIEIAILRQLSVTIDMQPNLEILSRYVTYAMTFNN